MYEGREMTENKERHGRLTRGGHGLPRVSPGPFYALQGGRPAAGFYPFGHPTPYAYEERGRIVAGSWEDRIQGNKCLVIQKEAEITRGSK
jgi:hypothetical protein